MTITLPQTLPTGVESLIVSQSVDGVEWELVEDNQIVKDNQYVVVATATEGYTIQNPIKSGTASAAIEVTSTDFEGKITPPAPAAVAQIGSTTYPSLGAAIAALTGAGETIELLRNYTVAADEVIAFAKNATLDLGGFTLTMPTAALSDKQFKVEADTEVTLQNGTIAQEAGGNRGLQVYGTVNVACTMTKAGDAAPVFDIFDGATVNAGADADITADAMIFWSKKGGNRTLNITGGKYHSGASATADGGYGVVYSSYVQSRDGCISYIDVTITDGEFTSKNGALIGWDNLSCTLDENCKAKFNTTANMAAYIKAGCELVSDGTWYTVQKIPTYTVDGITVANASVVATNKTVGGATFALPADLLRDTQIAVTVTPDTDYEYATAPAGWIKNGNGSITTNATVTADLAITVEAPTAAITPVKPGEPITGKTPEEVNANLDKYLEVPEIPGIDAATYRGMFAAKQSGDNVVIDLKPAVEEDIQDELDAATATVLAPDEDGKATITARIGLYYGIKAAGEVGSVDAEDVQNGVQATTTTLKITVPTADSKAAPFTSKAFFKTVCSPAAVE